LVEQTQPQHITHTGASQQIFFPSTTGEVGRLFVARARAKAGRAGCPVELGQLCPEQLPFPDAFFDTVLSAFTLALAVDLAQKARS
jgi:hypothetical protein